MAWTCINSNNILLKDVIFFVLCFTNRLVAAPFDSDIFWDDDNRRHLSGNEIFKDNTCYTNTCNTQIIRVLNEFPDRVRCYDETSPCRCCLRKTLSTRELKELNQEISFRSLSTRGKSCKTLDCEDYQVKAIRSLSSPNAECFDYGIQCRCCVNTQLKNEDTNSLVRDLRRLKENSNQNRTWNIFDDDFGSFDTFSDSQDGFDASFFDFPTFDNDEKSPPFDWNVFDGSKRSKFSDSECSKYDCNGPEVKNIKRMPIHVMNCVKIGNTNECDCCFNSTISFSDRLKYEFDLFSSTKSVHGSEPKRDGDFFGISSERDQNFEIDGDICDNYECSNDFYKLLNDHHRYLFSCSQNSAGQCKCCMNLNMRNMNKFLKFPIF